MKKILLSLLTIALVTTVAIGATRAWFFDTEASIGNSFTAGTLDLTVDGQDGPQVVHITKTNMKPQAPYTYQGYNNQFVLKNVGSLPGTVIWKIKNVQNFENGCNEPEASMGDVTCGANEGELGQYTWVKWSENGPTYRSFGPQFNPLNSANDVVVVGPTLQPNETLNTYMWLDFPGRADNLDNLTQSDSMTFDIEFTLNQIQ